jgi:hypothetical protein
MACPKRNVGRTGGKSLPLTHEFLSLMLSVRRHSGIAEAFIRPQSYSALVFDGLLLRAKMRALPVRPHRRQPDSGWRSAHTAISNIARGGV